MKAAKIVLVAGVLAVVAGGCLGSTKSLCEYADGKACVDVDGGLDGAMPDGVAPDGTIPDTGTDAEPPPKDCLTPMEPAKNPEKCLVDAFGAFVSPSGDDANDGTKAKPYKTLGRALQGVRTRLVVCEGEHAGSIDVTRAVEIYSGVTCDFTKAGGKAKLVASKAAYAIKVEKVAGPVVLADLDVVGMNGAAPSESSVGVFVTESGNVKLLRSRVEAGDGADAPMARDGSFTFPADTMLKGANADDKMTGIPGDDTGGAGGSTGTCPGGGNSKGGDGGNASLQGGDAAPRPPGGAKGPVGDCTAAGAGLPGDPGPPGQSRSGAVVPAALTSSGMAGSKGQDGSPGTIGGGGGGGFGFSGAGGGGGAGGCGGQGGFGGGAGGSSIAVLSFASTVSLESTELIAKVAKPGGTGGKGQTGQLGGARGTGSGMACNGGNGAKGGDGGAGGGGAGGIAAGIAWAGKEPTKDAATKITRPTGPAPVGGEGGAGASNRGVDGAHADVFEVK